MEATLEFNHHAIVADDDRIEALFQNGGGIIENNDDSVRIAPLMLVPSPKNIENIKSNVRASQGNKLWDMVEWL